MWVLVQIGEEGLFDKASFAECFVDRYMAIAEMKRLVYTEASAAGISNDDCVIDFEKGIGKVSMDSKISYRIFES